MAVKRRTLLEIDAILQRATARQLHGRTDEPDPDNLLFNKHDMNLDIGHLSDARTGLHVRKSRYSTNELKEFYPVSPEAATNTTTVIDLVALTATSGTVTSQPAAGRVHEVEFIYAAGNGAFAANRQLDVQLFDGTNNLPIYGSGVAAIVGTEAGLIFPTDEFTAVATYPGSRNSFDIWNGTYLRFIPTGLAAAEEINIRIHWKVKDAGGLRQ